MAKATKSLRDFKNAKMRRDFLTNKLKLDFSQLVNTKFTDEDVEGKNIENLIGAIEIPLAVAGPLTIRSTHYPLPTTHYIPLATTEGALAASISRGAKAITESGGADVIVESVGITRGPVFKTNGIIHSQKAKGTVEKNFKVFEKLAKTTSNHLILSKIDTQFVGNNLYCRMYFDTQDAMGMNMATIAAFKIAQKIEALAKITLISLAGNFDVDKKPSWLNFTKGRGKQVWAQVSIDKKTVKDILKTTPEKIVRLVQTKQHLGSILSGTMGANAHFANITAAIFIACGQDPAHVVESSMGITTAETNQNGNLQFAIYIPALVIGTIGGGTRLPAQNQALKIATPKLNVLEFAKVIAGAVLAGELSLTASLAEGTLAKAHQKLGRAKTK